MIAIHYRRLLSGTSSIAHFQESKTPGQEKSFYFHDPSYHLSTTRRQDVVCLLSLPETKTSICFWLLNRIFCRLNRPFCLLNGTFCLLNRTLPERMGAKPRYQLKFSICPNSQSRFDGCRNHRAFLNDGSQPVSSGS